jgi:hypothetical protein
MDIVGSLCDLEVKRTARVTDAYFEIAAVDRDMNTWFSELPDYLKWTPANAGCMPRSFFLLQ